MRSQRRWKRVFPHHRLFFSPSLTQLKGGITRILRRREGGQANTPLAAETHRPADRMSTPEHRTHESQHHHRRLESNCHRARGQRVPLHLFWAIPRESLTRCTPTAAPPVPAFEGQFSPTSAREFKAFVMAKCLFFLLGLERIKANVAQETPPPHFVCG